MTVFERIKEISKKQGKSLSAISQEAGMGEKAIYKWKNNTPTIERVKAVADVLGVSVDYLLGNTDEMHPTAENSKVDIKEVAARDSWDDYLSSNGRPLSDHDKNVLRALFGE